MHALIFDGRVIQVEAEPFEVHESMTWAECENEVQPGWLVIDGVPVAPAGPTLTDRQVSVVSAITAERDRRLSEGAPYAGRRIEVSDKGRADLSGMAVTALAAAAGSLPWPESYSRGWIAIDNERIPLPTPAEGLLFGATVGEWYAAMMQRARDLKDQALASDEPETIDVTTGWPGDEPAA
jgi:hypothetical protein